MEEADGEFLDRLQFLYEQRMVLFNTRREHEWKVIFGVIGLIFGLDAAVLLYHIELDGWKRVAWLCLILLPTLATYRYEWVLQRRTFFDRRAMNRLYNRICDSIGINEATPIIREPEHSRWSGLWAFIPQALVLLTISAFSAALPWIGIKFTIQPK